MITEATIVYYTSNQEEKSFEDKIVKKLLEVSGNLPIISVSHKPMDLGTNICIGIHKPTNVLLYHQILIGAKLAKTPFVISAESDFLYPPDYFKFIPPKLDQIYRYNHIRLMYKYHWGFFRKRYSEGAQIVGREFFISFLEKKLRKIPMNNQDSANRQFNVYADLSVPFEMFGSEIACVTFKTGNSLHKFTRVEREHSLPELPYWGKVVDMRKKMFNI